MNVCVLGYDALDPRLVEKFGMENLKQAEYGKTDISEFDKVATPIIWGSGITGQNIESDFTKERGSQTMRNVLKKPYRTLKRLSPKSAIALRKFLKNIGVLTKIRGDIFKVNVKRGLGLDTVFDRNGSVGINIPGYNWENMPKHSMDDFFEDRVDEEEYDKGVWSCYEDTKEKLLSNLDKNFVMAWFSPADRIGHIWRGDEDKMRETYKELNDLAGKVKEGFDGLVLIFSDHGMDLMGDFGDHTDIDFGYWSSSRKLGLRNPRFVNFKFIIEDLLDDDFYSGDYSQNEIGSGERQVKKKYEDEQKEMKKRLEDLGYFD